jgi:tetratricopeptide (TPR) repeat protein
MPEFPLKLCRRQGPPRTADAWYLASGDVREWLAEIAGWSTGHADVVIVPLGRDGHELETAGALLIPAATATPPSPRCVPFARVAPDFYVPADANIIPPLEPAELTALFVGEYIHVWRPSAGLVAADRAEVLRAHDLVAPGDSSLHWWDRAVSGVAHPQRLLSIEPNVQIDLSSIIEDGRDDIGADADTPDKLPKAPSEPGSGILATGARAAAITAGVAAFGITKTIGSVMRLFSAPAGQGGKSAGRKPPPKQPGAIGKFINQQIARISRSLHDARHRELQRLLSMLDKEPDKGLRFAIPFSEAAHRGLSPPGGHLMERLTDFSLRSLGGGRPADYWDIPTDYQQQLRTKYRDLANREIRLNRHRRAAYIFAELLGDFESAAAALRDGRHYREAAVLYRDRLKRPLDAARCLENGGLWAEAIAEYEQLEMHEKIGELYLRIDDSQQATAAFQAAAAHHRDKSDFVSAARICEERLDDPDAAAVDLETGWLSSTQGAPCMRALFGLLAHHGRHAAAADRAGDLAVEAADSPEFLTITNLLAEFAGNYPDADVRDVAAENAKRVIGGRLRAASHAEADSLCRALARLAPEDQLLARDTRRFVDGKRPPARIAPPRPATPRLRIVQSWSFGHAGCWQTAALGAKTLLVAGIVEDRVMLCRSDLEGHIQRMILPWPKRRLRSDAQLLLAANPTCGDRFGVWVVGEEPLPANPALVPTGQLVGVTVGALQGTSAAFGAACDSGGVTWVAEDRKGAVVAALGAKGALIATHRLPVETVTWEAEQHLPLPMVTHNGRLYVALSSTLFSLNKDAEPERFEMPWPIHSLCASAPHTLTRLAVGLDVGAQLLWDGGGHRLMRPFADHMSEPVLGFNRGGYVIAASGTQLEVYDTKNQGLARVAEGTLSKSPLTIFSLPAADRFGVFDQAGDVTIYEIGS